MMMVMMIKIAMFAEGLYDDGCLGDNGKVADNSIDGYDCSNG